MVVALVVPYSASAACFTRETGLRPTSISFGDAGQISDILVDGDVLTYSSVLPGNELVVTIEAQGLFTLGSERSDGMRRRLNWTETLPEVGDLKVGANFERFALIVGEGVVPFRMAIEVVEAAEIEVDGCRYDVLEVAVRQGPADQPQMTGRRWFDPWTMLTYRTELEFYDDTGKVTRRQETQAVSME